MGKELSLEEGIQEVLRLADGTEKPVIVGIYGMPDSGKTHFRTMLRKELEKAGKTINVGKIGDTPRDNFDPNPDYMLLEGLLWLYREKTIGYYGKPVDIAVLVKNEALITPGGIKRTDGYQYDIIIDNPNSKRKRDSS